MPLIPAHGKHRQVALSVFQARARFTTVRAKERNYCPRQKKKKPKKSKLKKERKKMGGKEGEVEEGRKEG